MVILYFCLLFKYKIFFSTRPSPYLLISYAYQDKTHLTSTIVQIYKQEKEVLSASLLSKKIPRTLKHIKG